MYLSCTKTRDPGASKESGGSPGKAFLKPQTTENGFLFSENSIERHSSCMESEMSSNKNRS